MGSGQCNKQLSDLYNKRTQIRRLLKSDGMEVFFSEEITPLDQNSRPIPFDIAEMIEANKFDLIVNIAGSPGSLLEADRINRKFLLRSLLWMPIEARTGFASVICKFLENEGVAPLYFAQEDVKSCVLTLGSQDWVAGLRVNQVGLALEAKMIQELTIGSARTGLLQ